MDSFNVLSSSQDVVEKIISAAYGRDPISRKSARGTVNRVLDLAKRRGYSREEEFVHYFHDAKAKDPRTTQRILRTLFEFVSVDEFVQLSRLSYFDN